MIKGLELAGPNPTHAAVIKGLRGLKSYNANGLLPNPINYSTIFGHDLREIVRVDTRGGEVGFQTPVVAALLWGGHPRNIDGQRLVAPSRRALSGLSVRQTERAWRGSPRGSRPSIGGTRD